MSKRSRLELIIEVDHDEDVDPRDYFLYAFDDVPETLKGIVSTPKESLDIFVVSEAWEDIG